MYVHLYIIYIRITYIYTYDTMYRRDVIVGAVFELTSKRIALYIVNTYDSNIHSAH